MKSLFGQKIFDKERSGLSHEVELHTKKATDKVKDMRER